MALSHLSRSIRDITGKTFARKFITLGRVINYWPQAVGPELAAKTYPVGMKVRKAQGSNKQGKTEKSSITQQPLEAILEIAASSADSTVLHYQKGLILERLRTLLGAAMIVDIRITHNAQAPISAINTMAALEVHSISEEPESDPLEKALKSLKVAIEKREDTSNV
jgi:hypothetical protein